MQTKYGHPAQDKLPIDLDIWGNLNGMPTYQSDNSQTHQSIIPAHSYKVYMYIFKLHS